MEKKSFVEWAIQLGIDYGSYFGVNEIENDVEAMRELGEIPSNDVWVICPECGDPIYKSDCDYLDGEDWECPACGFKLGD